MNLRPATPSDAASLIQTHYAAVHGTAAGSYPPEVLAAWSAEPSEARNEWMRQTIGQGSNAVVLAEDESGVLGFGILIVSSGELRALYVRPSAGRRGVGEALLRWLENRALEAGLEHIRLDASTNAEAFYRRNGYMALSPGTFRLSNECEMACVKMSKSLGTGRS